MWLDLQIWTADGPTNGVKEIKTLIQHLPDLLQAAGFEERKVYAEWCSLQTTIKTSFIQLEYQKIWEKIFVYRRRQFPDICLLAELAITSSPSSPGQHVFSILTTRLTDLRLTMALKTMEDCILIAGNKNAWKEQEKEEILSNATRKYLSTRNRRERPVKEKDLGNSTTPTTADPSVDKLLSSPSSSSSCKSGVSSKSSVSSESGDFSSDEL